MDMLNNLRDLLNVRNAPIISGESIPSDSRVNLNAGAELLEHFHQQWEKLHQSNEDNAAGAQKAAEIIENIHSYITAQNMSISKINQLLTNVPSLHNAIETCNQQVQQLSKSFEQVEQDLMMFEDIVEQQALEQKKNNHRYQLALYEEKKLANLETLRTELAQKHAQAVIDAEVKKKQVLEERQKAFEDAFKSDLETYKTLGTIPKIQVKSQPSALLEEIQLDIDDLDLKDFLDDK